MKAEAVLGFIEVSSFQADRGAPLRAAPEYLAIGVTLLHHQIGTEAIASSVEEEDERLSHGKH